MIWPLPTANSCLLRKSVGLELATGKISARLFITPHTNTDLFLSPRRVRLPSGYHGKLYLRSSMVTAGLACEPGIVDEGKGVGVVSCKKNVFLFLDYVTDEVFLTVTNTSSKPVILPAGTRFAQMVLDKTHRAVTGVIQPAFDRAPRGPSGSTGGVALESPEAGLGCDVIDA